jgi:hypothetical protein
VSFAVAETTVTTRTMSLYGRQYYTLRSMLRDACRNVPRL